jgi:type I restriction enzyme R subunit
MCTQSEAELEENLIKQLVTLGYERVTIRTEAELLANLKAQLEKHNGLEFSEIEFQRILNHLNKGNVFAKAKTLRDKFLLARDDGTSDYIEFLNQERWCQNEYQVTHQVTIEGVYTNRYDVTLLVNGLPLAQVELKRRGLELKEAFNQINRYQRHSYSAGAALFHYVQVFVISNGVNTKYYANNRKQSFKQTFYWADEKNELITKLEDFAKVFLEKCQLSKLICQYIVLHESDNVLMILRPYQYFAVEAIIERVKKGTQNGYIWHTTGSGKTLTSFKAAQILTQLPKVHKVVFVVDRADLDYQTTREFNHFSEGSVDGTDNTGILVTQLKNDTKLIVTTIQKLNTAIHRARYAEDLADLKDKRIVFIFDECHRSQFGETHTRITQFFERAQMFGFTGTPIFADNAIRNQMGLRTTKDLFKECLHRYLITNAISDGNVLKFSVEYWGKITKKDGSIIDEQVAGIDTKEFFEDPARIEKIVDWIITNHPRKTHNKDFTAMMCVSSVDVLTTYYELFRAKRMQGHHNLNVVTIFTYGTNEDDKDADGLIAEPDFDLSTNINAHSRDKLESYIGDYNTLYGTKFSARESRGFYAYYKDIAKRIKEREKVTALPKDRVDILLVVNMFLTGFDAKKVNTLYVDKNLKHHGLIQAFSRTNRILNEVKSQGNVVCFRNLKPATDAAIRLFSDENAKEEIIIEPYEDYVVKFNDGVKVLRGIVPTVEDVSKLVNENDKLKFVQAFRSLMRIRNILSSFSQFTWGDLTLTAQEFEDYKSKYLDIYEESKGMGGDDPISIIQDVDFELELITRDDINVAYILALLQQLHDDITQKNKSQDDQDKQKEAILNLLGRETKLRSKRTLIEKFINEYMPTLTQGGDVSAAFSDYWNAEKNKGFKDLCEAESLDAEKLRSVIENYMFSGRAPLRESVIDLLNKPPSVLQRKTIAERITEKILNFVKIFEDDLGDI